MILPSKHISLDYSLLGIGGILLRHLKRPQTVTSLWDQVRENQEIGTYERFVLALDFLYIVGLITVVDGLIRQNN